MAQTANYSRYKLLFSILAVVVFIWGAVGALDITNIPYTGYNQSPDNVVTLVREGSPAEKAGLKVGDTILKIDNIPVSDTANLTDRPRPSVNSEGSLAIRRGTTEQVLTLKYAPFPMVDLIANFGAGILTGLAFLILGLMIYLKHPTRLSSGFCILSLLFAILMFNPPYLASPILRRVSFAVLNLLAMLLLAVILDYCLHFPRTKQIVTARPWLRQVIYLIAGASGVALSTIILTTPPMSPRRGLLLSLGVGLVVGGYLLLAVISVIHSYLKASAEERAALGLNQMLLGMVIGLGPVTLAVLLHALIPRLGELPGERFYTITMLAIPIGLALALMKLEPAAIKVEEARTT